MMQHPPTPMHIAIAMRIDPPHRFAGDGKEEAPACALHAPVIN
jgi:hypothetical protein